MQDLERKFNLFNFSSEAGNFLALQNEFLQKIVPRAAAAVVKKMNSRCRGTVMNDLPRRDNL